MPDTNEQRDPVKEARALLTKVAPSGKITNGADAYLFDMRGPALLKTLCDEVDRLREISNEAYHKLGSSIQETNAIHECDKCELCEDHHA